MSEERECLYCRRLLLSSEDITCHIHTVVPLTTYSKYTEDRLQLCSITAERDALREVLQALLDGQVRCQSRVCHSFATVKDFDSALDPVFYCEIHADSSERTGDQHELATADPIRRALKLLEHNTLNNSERSR